MTTRRSTQKPDFSKLRYFKERGGLGFGVSVWSTYFTAPLYAQIYKRFDILPDEFSILASLYESGSLTAQTISAITGRPKNTISRGVTRLLASGRIKRVINPSDRREAFLSLLADGRKLYERLLPLCREREMALLQALSTDELVLLDTLLMKLLLFYHQSPEGIGFDTLRQLGIPTNLEPDES